MKKIALALAGLSLSSAALADSLDYNHMTGSLAITSADNVDSQRGLSFEGNQRLNSGLFFGGSADYNMIENLNGSDNDSFGAAAEVGIAMGLDLIGLSESHELAAAIGISYSDFTDANTDQTDYSTRLKYSYNCDNGRQYSAEYSHDFAKESTRNDNDSLRVGVEGGNRNSWRYDVGYTRDIENEANNFDASFIVPLAPQDQGEIVVGMTYGKTDSNIKSNGFNVGYRWNLD